MEWRLAGRASSHAAAAGWKAHGWKRVRMRLGRLSEAVAHLE